MWWQISCFLDQSEDRECSRASLSSWLNYFALSFIHLLGPERGGHDNNSDNCLTDAQEWLKMPQRIYGDCSEYSLPINYFCFVSSDDFINAWIWVTSKYTNIQHIISTKLFTNIGNTMFWQCQLSASPHPSDWVWPLNITTQPIRGQYPGHVITLHQSEATLQTECDPLHHVSGLWKAATISGSPHLVPVSSEQHFRYVMSN